MLAAPVPTDKIPVPAIVRTAEYKLSATLKGAGPGKFAVAYCHRTAPRYGSCAFTMRFTSKLTGAKFLCHGVVRVRNIGHGYEASYDSGVICNGKRVS